MNEAEFAYRVRQALDEGAERLDYTVSLRLEKARHAALERSAAPQQGRSWVPALRLAGAGAPADQGSRPAAWLLRFGLAAPLVALAIAIVGIEQWQSDRAAAEYAAIDFAVLLDDTPIDTYAHKGFGVLLSSNEQDEEER
jgi:hypothetical protein